MRRLVFPRSKRCTASLSGVSPKPSASRVKEARPISSICFGSFFRPQPAVARTCTATRITVNCHPSRLRTARSSGVRWRSLAAAAPLSANSLSSLPTGSPTDTLPASARGSHCRHSRCKRATFSSRSRKAARLGSVASIWATFRGLDIVFTLGRRFSA